MATLETLVHVSLSMLPTDLKLASIDIPEGLSLQEVGVLNLPANWRDYPAPPELAERGTQWAESNGSLLLRVPSAVIPQEFNLLVNPMHPEMRRVKLIQITDWVLDERLIRRESS